MLRKKRSAQLSMVVRVHTMPDYDNPEVETQWFAERRNEIDEYLKHEGIAHGPIATEPAWYIAPFVSIWAVNNFSTPSTIGWWVISGDLPNDYVSASDAKNPREAMACIASLWQEAAGFMLRGEQHPTFIIGKGECNDELAPMLASRADTLLSWVNDPECWEENEL